jgi:hypothetical protein
MSVAGVDLAGRTYGQELYDFHAAVVPDRLGERIMPGAARAGA